MPYKELTAVGVLAMAMFFRMFGIFVALPLAALFARQLASGELLWVVGLAVGGYGITQALMQIPSGLLADRLGRKPVLVAMLLIFSAGSFVCAYADSVWQLAAGRLLQGGGAVAAITSAWIADVVAPERRARALLVYGVSIALAFVLALFLAPLLADIFKPAGVFALAGGLGIVSAISVCLLPSAPQPPPTEDVQLSYFNASIKIYAAIAFISHYILSSLFLQIPLLLEKHLALESHWRLYIPAFVLSLFITLPLVFRRQSRLSPIIAFALMWAAMLVFVVSDHSQLELGLGMFLFFAGFTALEALIPARASCAAPAQRRAAALGVVMCMGFLGMFAGAFISGLVSNVAGANAALATGLLLITAGFVIITKAR